jgi:hypothetical protein
MEVTQELSVSTGSLHKKFLDSPMWMNLVGAVFVV